MTASRLRSTLPFFLLLFLSFGLLRWARFQTDQDEALCAKWSQKGRFPVRQVQGTVTELKPWGAKLGGVSVWEGGAKRKFSGELSLQAEGLKRGDVVRVWGKLRCIPPYRNPAAVARDRFLPSVSKLSAGFRPKWRVVRAATHWGDLFQPIPALRPLFGAVWTGRASALPKTLEDFYLKCGLLHVIALSGQHVVILVLLVRGALYLLGRLVFGSLRRKPRGALWWHGLRALPVFCAGLLFFTSGGAPSMARTLAMALGVWVLSYRALSATPFQWAASSVACLCLIDPRYFLQPGFVFSALATLLLLFLVSQPTRWLRSYLGITVFLPLLLFPATAFYFAKVSWLSPLSALVVAWLWDAFWIPVGFLLPIVKCLPSFVSSPIQAALARLWKSFVGAHERALPWVDPFFSSVVCPTWLEVILIQSFLLLVFLLAAQSFNVSFARRRHAPKHLPPNRPGVNLGVSHQATQRNIHGNKQKSRNQQNSRSLIADL